MKKIIVGKKDGNSALKQLSKSLDGNGKPFITK